VFRNWRIGERNEFKQYAAPGDAAKPGQVIVSRYYFGADWGFSIDPSVLVRCFIVDRRLYIDAEVYVVGCEIDHLPFLFGGLDDNELRRINAPALDNLVLNKKQLWRGIPGSRRWPIIADSSRPDTISFMQRHGFSRMTEAKKGAGSVDEGVEFLQSMDIVVHPDCVHTIHELSNYAYKVDPKTEEVLPVLEDKDNHVIDALRYALEGARHSTYDLDALAS
jgi:phage terminase large subunit